MNNYNYNSNDYERKLKALYEKYMPNGYTMGDNFDSVKDTMSDQDYESANNLLNYYAQQKNTNEMFNSYAKSLEQNKNNQMQAIDANRQLASTQNNLNHYLKSTGRSGVGMDGTLRNQINNAYANQKNNVLSNYDTQQNSLLQNYISQNNNLMQNYNTDNNNLLNRYAQLEDEKKANIYSILQNQLDTEYSKMLNENGSDTLTSSQKQKLLDLVEQKKSKISQNDYDTLLEYISTLNSTTAEEEARAEIDESIISGKKNIEYNGEQYRIKNKLDNSQIRDKISSTLKNMGYENGIESENIPNGTSIKVSIVKAVGRKHITIPYYMTYYNGQWYYSDKQ